MQWKSSVWIILFVGFLVVAELKSAVGTEIVEANGTNATVDLCEISVFSGRCRVLINGNVQVESRITVPCDEPVTLFAPPRPDCSFAFWTIPPNMLPAQYMVFANPWIFTPASLPTDRAPDITAVFDVEQLSFVRQLEDVALYIGQSHRLQVQVHGGTSLRYYEWIKDHSVLDIFVPYLTLDTATSLDSGVYTCHVWSPGSYDIESSATITVYSRASEGFHHADGDQNWLISLLELLRVVQFYNVGSYHCGLNTEDGYAPGTGDTACSAHHGDYGDEDWAFSLNEVLRIIQFYNAPGGAYHAESGTEDGFAPQAG